MIEFLKYNNFFLRFFHTSSFPLPGVFSCDENCTKEDHGESDITSDTESSEGQIGGEGYSDEYYDIMDEELDVYEAELSDAPDLQLSTGEFTKYEITEPGKLDIHQRRWKIKYKMCPVSEW